MDRWRQGQIGFHQPETHAALPRHWASLGVPSGGTVFVPLCGKSRDMLWLRAQGHAVIGVELSEIAVRDFFAQNGLEPDVAKQGRLDRYTADGVTLLRGDLFDLTPDELAGVVGVYDRASLIALPPEMRERYVEKLSGSLAEGTPILLVTISYPDGEMEGPPFSVTEDEVRRLYSPKFDVERLSTTDALAENPQLRQRGLTTLDEQVYRITRRRAR